jgi:hypothetical protein
MALRWNARLLSLPRLAGGRAPSLKGYQERLWSVNGLKVKARAKARSGLILHALEPREGGEINQGKLPNPELIGHLSIRYWTPADEGDEEGP